MTESSITHEKIVSIFSDYLAKNHYRKTVERFTVLHAIYSSNKHFNVDTLYTTLKKEKKYISKATLYNTIELLLSCHLIRRNQFGKAISFYEPAYKYKQHDHIICTECHHVIEYYEPSVEKIKMNINQKYKFSINYHSLHLYGICSYCQKK